MVIRHMDTSGMHFGGDVGGGVVVGDIPPLLYSSPLGNLVSYLSA